MLKKIEENLNLDRDYPRRSHKIDIYTRVLNGELYDTLPYAFCDEYQAGKYIPLWHRQPSVKNSICKSVVDESVSLLFGSDHFPTINIDNEDAQEKLNLIIKEIKLRQKMLEAAMTGSVGSVVLFLRFIEGKPQIEVKGTQYLTPYFNPANPTELLTLVEQYKVNGSDLIRMGYSVNESSKYWFMREWDEEEERYYQPFLQGEEPKIDDEKTIKHGLGFVPAVWIKNLPKAGSKGHDEVDGACTFAAAIDNSIEIDYLLSQGGRALKYSSDPLVIFKLNDDFVLEKNATSVTGDYTGPKKIIRSSSNAFVLGPDDDAKLLEISGRAAEALITQVRYLRELAMEAIHGNRSHADKVSVAHSGAAMDKLNQALLWLVDVLRIYYGENGIVPLINMIIQASRKVDLVINGQSIGPLPEASIALNWPDWESPTVDEKKKIADTLKILADSKHISQETAVKFIAEDYNISDVEEEIKRIDEDQAELEKLEPILKETINV